jgi:HEPN domain-containing protein
MPDLDNVLAVVCEWVIKAENDLKNAAHSLKLGEECPTDTVCFHAQQCVEKYLKALLVWKQTPFAKTHDIGVIAALVPAELRPDLTPEEARRLTKYGTITRYPGDDEPISLTEARRAVRLARRVRTAVRRLLPKETLRRRR